MLGACRLGADRAGGWAEVAPEWWGWLAAMLPLGLLSRRTSLRLVVWLAVVVASYQCGAGLARRVDETPCAAAPDRWRPCQRVEFATEAVVRLRARPRRGRADRWTAPATILNRSFGSDSPLANGPGVGESIYLRGQGEPPPGGTTLAADLKLRPPARAKVPGGFDTAAWLAGRGMNWTAQIGTERPPQDLESSSLMSRVGRWQTALQSDLRCRLGAGLPPREAAVAAAVLLGGGADPEIRDTFARLGLAHLFALSGLHVGILAGLALFALRPAHAGPVLRLAVLGPLLAAYVVLVDLPGSVVRAAGLVTLTLLGPVLGRRVTSLRLLGVLLWGNLLWQPAAALDTGLRLSYLAAGGIVAGQLVLGPRLQSLSPRLRPVLAAMCVTVSAQLATLPEIARSFGFLPLIGPVANLLLVPVFAVAVTLLAAGLTTSVVWPWAGQGVLACGWLCLRPLGAAAAVAARHGAGLEAGLPGWTSAQQLAYLVLLALLAATVRRGTRALLIVAAGLYLSILAVATHQPARRGAVNAWQFAVGQGDCAILRFPDGWQAIIDTGPVWRSGASPLARNILPWLRRHGVDHLDAVVLTHGHADHTGGRDALAAALPVTCWYTAGAARPGPGQHRRLAPGDTLHAAGGWSLVCLHPDSLASDDFHENDHSLVLGLCLGDSLRGLWTGDLEFVGEAQLIPHLPPIPAAGIDVLKAGHHGSKTSSTAALLSRLRPQLVVVSCGVDNRHRHPSHGPYVVDAETLAVMRTDLQGTVHLRWSPTGGFLARPLREMSIIPPVVGLTPSEVRPTMRRHP